MPRILLNIYGVEVSVECDNEAICSQVARDFSYFKVDKTEADPSISVSCSSDKPPYESLPDGRPIMVRPSFVAYQKGDWRIVDYYGRALSRWDFSSESGTLWSLDPSLLWEKLYLLVHSRVGEGLDRMGMHRVHALGLSVRGRGVICLLPSGGGKTTLGLQAMELGGVKLLSDDTPLITRKAEILPFPMRIGLGEKPTDFEDRFVRRFNRQEHGLKWLIDIEAFGDSIEIKAVKPQAILLGRRLLEGEASISPIPKRAVLPELFRSSVVGVGLPQLVEYFLRFELKDVPNKTKIVLSRTAACLALLKKSKTYRFDLGRDLEENKQVLESFLRSLS